MGFDEVGKKDNYLLILLDKKQNTFLKVIEQKKLKNLPKRSHKYNQISITN